MQSFKSSSYKSEGTIEEDSAEEDDDISETNSALSQDGYFDPPLTNYVSMSSMAQRAKLSGYFSIKPVHETDTALLNQIKHYSTNQAQRGSNNALAGYSHNMESTVEYANKSQHGFSTCSDLDGDANQYS